MVTGLVFKWFGMSINTMTLGGLAVAIGELVDDAIVDVENIFRRLRENQHAAHPKPALRVVYEASSEVRNSIVFSTILVVLVFVPLFALGGMEGRLFTPLGVAYIVSILASLVVSLTVTPVLSYWLLPQAKFMAHEKDGLLLRFLKWLAGFAIRFSVRHPVADPGRRGSWPCSSAWSSVTQLGRDFLPPFNEGSVQVNVLLPPGTSLADVEPDRRHGRRAARQDRGRRRLRPPHGPGRAGRARRRGERLRDHHQLRSRTPAAAARKCWTNFARS